MFNRITATLAAAAIAVTSFGAAPAAADDRDAARIAAAVLGVAIIGKILHDKNKRDEAREVSRRQVEPAPVSRSLPHRRDVEPRPLPRRVDRDYRDRHVDRKLLPQQCFRSYDTRRGSVHMFGSRCLQKNYRFSNRLPQACEQQVRTERGIRTGFDARCLRSAGYSLARG